MLVEDPRKRPRPGADGVGAGADERCQSGARWASKMARREVMARDASVSAAWIRGMLLPAVGAMTARAARYAWSRPRTGTATAR